MRETEIIEGVRNYVVNWAQVRKGEHVLVLADSLADRMLVDLIAAVVRGEGANVVVSWIDFNPLQARGAGPIIAAALHGATKVLRLTFSISHDRGTVQAVQERGVAIYGAAVPTAEFFAREVARFPAELSLAIERLTEQKIWSYPSPHTIKVTHKNGTNLRAMGRAEDWGGYFQNTDFKWDIPAVYPRTFPGQAVGLITPFAGEGVAYYDAFSGVGVCSEPLKLTYKDNRCVEIEGGAEADKLRSNIRGIPYADYLCEIMYGLHPKIRANAPLDQKPLPNEAERRAGNLHIAIGNRPLIGGLWHEMKKVKGSYRDSHLDGFIVKPSVYINDEPLVEEGHVLILDDPELKRIAEKYGDPNELLTLAGPD